MQQESMQLDQLRSKETFEAWTQKGMGPVSAPWLVKIPSSMILPSFCSGISQPCLSILKDGLREHALIFFDSRTFPGCMPVLDASKPVN